MSGQCITLNGTTVYRTKLPACPAGDRINVLANIEHSVSYKYTVTDKFGHEYKKIITTDTDGNFFLMLEDLPKQLFTPHSGSFTLTLNKVVNNDVKCDLESFLFCDLEEGAIVNHVMFSFYVVNISTEAIIGCKCD